MAEKNVSRITYHVSRNEGQSLVEVVVGIGLVTTVLVALVSAMNRGLGNAQFTRNKSKATAYAQEALEWVRSQRDGETWQAFVAQAGTGSCGSKKYCLNSLGASFPGEGACANNVVFDTIYQRNTTLVRQSDDQVRVDVTVTWPEGNRTGQVASSTQLSNWQPQVPVATPSTCP